MGLGVKCLTIRRLRGGYGMARALKLVVDGEEVGALRQGREIEIMVPLDARELVGRMDWGRTEPLSLRYIPHGARIDLRCRFTLSQRRMLGLAPLPVSFEVFLAGVGR